MASGVCLKCSCSLPTKCLAHACTPVLWMPRIESANNLPVRYGSGLKPSQLRPPSGDCEVGCQYERSTSHSELSSTLPRPPATGPSRTVTPLSRLSEPIALPRAYANSLSHVAPTLMPAGKTDTRLCNVSDETNVTLTCGAFGLLSVSYADWRILETLASDAQTRHTAGLTNTLLLLPSGPC